MRQLFARCCQLSLTVVLTSSFNTCPAQQGAVATLRASTAGPNAHSSSAPVAASEQAAILERFVAAETRVREALNQHTFKRDVVLQTIGPNGQVTGEYIRNSQFLFDDRGNRIERVVYHPSSTIREMRITREDIQDLAGAQLLGVDIAETGKYRLSYGGTELLDSRTAFVIDVAPATTPDSQNMKERFFVGRVWIDGETFRVIKVRGI